MVLAVGIGSTTLLHLQPVQAHLAQGEPIVAALEHSIWKSACHDLHRDHAGDRGRDLVFSALKFRPTWASCWRSCSSSTW